MLFKQTQKSQLHLTFFHIKYFKWHCLVLQTVSRFLALLFWIGSTKQLEISGDCSQSICFF